jgi:hypothetical protein
MNALDKRKRLKEIQKEIERNLKSMKGASCDDCKRLIDLNAPLHNEYSRLIDELLKEVSK